jgi:hypothetical protein
MRWPAGGLHFLNLTKQLVSSVARIERAAHLKTHNARRTYHMLSIKFEGAENIKEALDHRKVASAMRMAINDAARAGRTAASREILAKFNVKATKVNQELKNVRMATNTNQSAVIQAKGRPIPLLYFGAREIKGPLVAHLGRKAVYGRHMRLTPREARLLKRRGMGRGIMVSIEKGKKTILRHAFMATMANGHMGVFERIRGKTGRRGKGYLEKIEQKAVITIASMFGQEQVQKRVALTVQDKWAERVVHHLDRLLNKKA